MPNLYFYAGSANPELYELQNELIDPERKIEKVMQEFCDFDGSVIVDVGAGSGFHSHMYAGTASMVYAVEPDSGMLRQLISRQARDFRSNFSVVKGFAEDLPLKSDLADIVHARLAYFFGPPVKYTGSCEEGIEEVKRVLKTGGHFFNIQNNYSSGQYADFLELSYGRDLKSLQREISEYFLSKGFLERVVRTKWRAKNREKIEKALTLEFPIEKVGQIMKAISGNEFSHDFSIFIFRKTSSGENG
ncbi:MULTISPECIES: class I SAM-dependent methyltransferase [unclassified Mesotoga]|uniref:class I SAM-dependent methyltransferase n=1 Tax=unclassified Mesotoga TaxID=1184398 RepID=UPI000CCBFB05|nr:MULTISPECIES: class I SAM-dependent methyltransferase [unclassified Mesotoga]PNS39570.1 methylase [Mesotoga sp. B105.6.4]